MTQIDIDVLNASSLQVIGCVFDVGVRVELGTFELMERVAEYCSRFLIDYSDVKMDELRKCRGCIYFQLSLREF